MVPSVSCLSLVSFRACYGLVCDDQIQYTTTIRYPYDFHMAKTICHSGAWFKEFKTLSLSSLPVELFGRIRSVELTKILSENLFSSSLARTE